MSDPNSPLDPRRQQAPNGPWPPVAGPYAPQGAPWGPTPTPPAQPTPYQAVDIRAYAAPRARTSVIVAVLAGLALLGVIVAGALIKANTPAARPTPTAASTTTTTAPGMPFTVPGDTGSTGRWEVLDRRWTSTGVSVHVRLTADTGVVNYAFEVYAKGASTRTRPTAGIDSPQLSTGRLDAGDSTDGFVFFRINTGEATLFLTTRDGRAISALPVRA